MKTIIIAVGSLLLLVLPSLGLAANKAKESPYYNNDTGYYHGVNVLRGTVISVGRVDPTSEVATGYFFDANYTSVAVNFGINSKHFGSARNDDTEDMGDEQVTTGYAGVGFSRIAQIQYGYGTEGGVVRFRSDINMRAIFDFLQQKHTPKSRLTLGDRLTFSVTIEKYQQHDEFDNATWGVGLLF